MRREACKRREAIIKVYDGRCGGSAFTSQTGSSNLLLWLLFTYFHLQFCSRFFVAVRKFQKFTDNFLSLFVRYVDNI